LPPCPAPHTTHSLIRRPGPPCGGGVGGGGGGVRQARSLALLRHLHAVAVFLAHYPEADPASAAAAAAAAAGEQWAPARLLEALTVPDAAATAAATAGAEAGSLLELRGERVLVRLLVALPPHEVCGDYLYVDLYIYRYRYRQIDR
jgi:hypothetical protein